MSTKRQQKRARWSANGPSAAQLQLAQIANVAGTSNRTLTRIVDLLRANQDLLDGGVTDDKLKETAEAFFWAVGCHLDLPQDDGSNTQWACASLPKVLTFFCAHSDNLQFLFRSLYERRPCTKSEPWSLIMYMDEAVPGALLRPDNLRKTMNYYVSIREFGPSILKHEAAWFPIAALRTSLIRHTRGNNSGALRILLRDILLDQKGVAHDGVVLNVGAANPIILFLKLGNLLYDGEACRSCLSVKGANGLLPCLCCKNVTNMPKVLEDNMVHFDASDLLVDISCPDPTRFIHRNDEELFMEADLLTALKTRLSNDDFKEQEKLRGLAYSPDGLLWDQDLREHVRVISVHTIDATHAFLCDGIGHREVALLCQRMKSECDITFAEIRIFMEADWHVCRCMGGSAAPMRLSGVFSVSRQKHFEKDHGIQAQAGEILIILAPLRFLLEWRVPPGVLDAEKKSFFAFCKVISHVHAAKEGIDSSDDMAQSIYEHSLRFRDAYADEGESVYVSKDHAAKHIPSQIKRDGGHLLDTFVGERYHSQMKAVATSVKVTKAFEKSLIGRAIMNHLRLLNAPSMFRDSLVEGKPSDRLPHVDGVTQVLISKSMRWHGTMLWERDIVRLDGAPCVVQSCANLDGELALLVHPCRFLAHVIWVGMNLQHDMKSSPHQDFHHPTTISQ